MANMQPNICPACSCKTNNCDCRLALHTDGNDKLKCRHEGIQRPFTKYPGGDAFADDKLAATFELATAKAKTGPDACGASFRVAQSQETSGTGGGTAVKGVVCGVCPHLLVLAAVPMAKGEKYHLHLTALFKALADHTSPTLTAERGIFHMCDISCSLRPWFVKAIGAMMDPQHIADILPDFSARAEFAGWDSSQVQDFFNTNIAMWLPELSRTRHGTSQLHSHAHSWDCHVRTAVRNQWQAGLLTGEEAEQVFSFLSAHSKFLRTMRPQSWRQVLSLLISAWNSNMTLRLARRLKGKFLRAIRDSEAQEAAVIDLAGKLRTSGVDLQCGSIADIASVVAENGLVQTWMKNFYARALQLEANRHHRCLALQRLLMREMLMVEDANGDAQPLPALADVAHMPTASLHLLDASAMQKPVADTLERLARIPGTGPGRRQLLAIARKDIQDHHSDQVTWPANTSVNLIADSIVAASKDVLSQRLLKSTLEDMFSLAAMIERLQRDLQINSGSTSQQRRMNASLKRHYTRMDEQLAVFSSILRLVLGASGSAEAQEIIDALSSTPTSNAVHAVILRLQQHFQWSTDALSSLDAEQFRLAQEISAQTTLYFRCREELRRVRKEFLHAAAYYDDQLTTVIDQWASLNQYLQDHWAADGRTSNEALLSGAEDVLAHSRFAVPPRGDAASHHTIHNWWALRFYMLGAKAHLADTGRELWARRAALKRALRDLVAATADRSEDPASHIDGVAADAMFADLDLRGLEVGEMSTERSVAEQEEEEDNEAVWEVESDVGVVDD